MSIPFPSLTARAVRFVGAVTAAASLALCSVAGAQAAERHKAPVAKKQSASAAAPARKVAARAPAGKSVARATSRVSQTFAGRRVAAPARVAYVPARPSYGQLAGLHGATDPLDLKSSVAFVIDQDTQEVLISKNDGAVLPIASITKLMTGTLISEAKLPMDEMVTITQDDVDTEKGSSSRLVVGSTLSRGEMLHLALMSSENRAAHALGRTYPGGLATFVTLMNAKARQLGMVDTHYVEPTGLSSRNQSSARDLATLVGAAYQDPLLRELTTSPNYTVDIGRRTLQYNNTNRLVHNPAWDIGLQKTGFINEAGQCLVMQARIAGRKLIMVFLDSAGKLSRVADAERVRRWVESSQAAAPVLARQNNNG
ncbi:D-alanyl-D-alanine endopeptidase [Xylophilus sp. Kf1]|nr:D-alanyl-D-alanine endopeptidase [Xylophilus sp. Kf1]